MPCVVGELVPRSGSVFCRPLQRIISKMTVGSPNVLPDRDAHASPSDAQGRISHTVGVLQGDLVNIDVRNVVWHTHPVGKSDRAKQKEQKPLVFWFTGLSGSGKSTLAGLFEQYLYSNGFHSYLIDGDNVRHGLNRDLGFGDGDRVENIRRVGELGKLMVDAGLIVLAAFISPFARDRALVRHMLDAGEFVEVYLDAPLGICEMRDPKGLYRRARAGEIRHFTGIDSLYEPPLEAEIVLTTGVQSQEQSLQSLIAEAARYLNTKID